MEKRKLELLMSVTVIICACLLAERGWMKVSQEHVTGRRATRIVVVDAGHGGVDPGKIGVDDSLEKDINLEIAERLKTILEQQDIQVVMTREEDKGLYEETASNKKAQDLKKRCSLINEGQADCAVSIHQNSFTGESSKGAQVFYQSTSEEGKKFAGIMQKKIASCINDGNHRIEKANSDYYILKNSSPVAIIVECGFLSNPQEAALLSDDKYQKKMSSAIAQGISEYIQKEAH